MYFEALGVIMNFSIGNVILALFLTFIIYIIIQFFNYLKKIAPFKKDKLANESLFYIHMISKNYFNGYQRFFVEGGEDFSRKLWQVSTVYNLERMQEESYRIKFQSLLRNHNQLLKESYELFEMLNHIPLLKRTDVEKVVNRTHQILNQIIGDINEEFKD